MNGRRRRPPHSGDDAEGVEVAGGGGDLAASPAREGRYRAVPMTIPAAVRLTDPSPCGCRSPSASPCRRDAHQDVRRRCRGGRRPRAARSSAIATCTRIGMRYSGSIRGAAAKMVGERVSVSQLHDDQPIPSSGGVLGIGDVRGVKWTSELRASGRRRDGEFLARQLGTQHLGGDDGGATRSRRPSTSHATLRRSA